MGDTETLGHLGLCKSLLGPEGEEALEKQLILGLERQESATSPLAAYLQSSTSFAGKTVDRREDDLILDLADRGLACARVRIRRRRRPYLTP